MRTNLAIAAALFCLITAASGQAQDQADTEQPPPPPTSTAPDPTPPPPTRPALPSPDEIAAAAPASDWSAIDPADLIIMDLGPDAAKQPRRVVIQLLPPPFAQDWIGNIRQLARAHWWDGTSVYRVQDNYVAQWGDISEKKALPPGLAAVPESQYSFTLTGGFTLPEMVPIGVDAYGIGAVYRGWPLAYNLSQQDTEPRQTVWPVHCYGMVGVARSLSPDTGSGSELYAVIGHAPRQLDRNIAVVGRVIEGIEHLSTLSRGKGALGFHEHEASRVPILAVRVADELPAAEQPRFEYLTTESDSFKRYSDARVNRRDPFFIQPAGGADICNIPVPIRPIKPAG